MAFRRAQACTSYSRQLRIVWVGWRYLNSKAPEGPVRGIMAAGWSLLGRSGGSFSGRRNEPPHHDRAPKAHAGDKADGTRSVRHRALFREACMIHTTPMGAFRERPECFVVVYLCLNDVVQGQPLNRLTWVASV